MSREGRPTCPKCQTPEMYEAFDPKANAKIWKCMDCGHEMAKEQPAPRETKVYDDVVANGVRGAAKVIEQPVVRQIAPPPELGWKERALHEYNVLLNKIGLVETGLAKDRASAEEIYETLTRIGHPGVVIPSWKARKAAKPKATASIQTFLAENTTPKSCSRCGRVFEHWQQYKVTPNGPVCKKETGCIAAPEGSADGVMPNSLREAFDKAEIVTPTKKLARLNVAANGSTSVTSAR